MIVKVVISGIVRCRGDGNGGSSDFDVRWASWRSRRIKLVLVLVLVVIMMMLLLLLLLLLMMMVVRVVRTSGCSPNFDMCRPNWRLLLLLVVVVSLRMADGLIRDAVGLRMRALRGTTSSSLIVIVLMLLLRLLMTRRPGCEILVGRMLLLLTPDDGTERPRPCFLRSNLCRRLPTEGSHQRRRRGLRRRRLLRMLLQRRRSSIPTRPDHMTVPCWLLSVAAVGCFDITFGIRHGMVLFLLLLLSPMIAVAAVAVVGERFPFLNKAGTNHVVAYVHAVQQPYSSSVNQVEQGTNDTVYCLCRVVVIVTNGAFYCCLLACRLRAASHRSLL